MEMETDGASRSASKKRPMKSTLNVIGVLLIAFGFGGGLIAFGLSAMHQIFPMAAGAGVLLLGLDYLVKAQ